MLDLGPRGALAPPKILKDAILIDFDLLKTHGFSVYKGRNYIGDNTFRLSIVIADCIQYGCFLWLLIILLFFYENKHCSVARDTHFSTVHLFNWH